jgi:hypothetical protein
MEVATPIPHFAEAIASLLSSNGVTLQKVLEGKSIYDNLASGHDDAFSKTRLKIDDITKVDEQCDAIAKMKNWPDMVVKPIRALVASNINDSYVCHGGCTVGSNGGLLVFVTMARKQESKIDLLFITSQHNISIAPEEIEKITTTVIPVVIELVQKPNWQPWKKPIVEGKIINYVATHSEIEKRKRHLDEPALSALRDFCLAKVCQRWITREKAHQIAWPDHEVEKILTYDFSKPQQ